MELLPEPGQAAKQRQFPERVGIDDRPQALAQNLDLAVGLAHGDSVRGVGAHHDALEHGLTAVEELVLAHSRAHPSPCTTPLATEGSTGRRVISSAAGAAGTGRRGPAGGRYTAGSRM